MMRFILFLVLFLNICSFCISTKVNLVWPQPQTLVQHDQYLLINVQKFKIFTNSDCDLIQHAIQRYRDRMFVQDCGELDSKYNGDYFLPTKSLNYSTDNNNYKSALKSLRISFNGECEKFPYLNMVEKYQLTINENGAEISGDSIWGALRGLETFSQLLTYVGPYKFAVNFVKVEDWPRFSHRGLLIDSSRHFLSMKVIRETVDAMEMNKLNVLHWHLVDDQSFPFVSETFPQLSKLGSYDPHHMIYSPNEIDDILEYARLRGIRVLVEFDTPGHTASWGLGQQNLLTPCYGPDGKPNGKFGPFNPKSKETYAFIRKFFAEISERFPDQYLHLGGDEVEFDCWASNPEIEKFMRQLGIRDNYSKLQSFYIENLLNIVNRDLNKSAIVWQEVFDHKVNLQNNKDTVVHVWKDWGGANWRPEMSRIVQSGYRALLSSPWYLDLISYGQDWIKYYEVDPLDFKATPEEKELVIGGEAAIWGEYVDGANLISKTWPRACAVAERLWSDASVSRAEDARERFHEMHCRMQRQGLRPGPIDGPGYCQCDYAL